MQNNDGKPPGGGTETAEMEDGIEFPQEVEDALKEVIKSTDQLDGKDFNPVDYINTLFPSEQSLANIDDVVVRIRSRIKRLDDEIRESIRKQADAVSNGKQALEEAKGAIHEVFGKIKDIKEKADESEDKVKEITRDIKQLDHGKRHLTASITTLNHLHMLVGGVDSLVALTKNRQYDEIANLLQGVLNVLDHFKKYIKIQQIKELSDKVAVIQKDLDKQILKDFMDRVEEGNVAGPNSQIADACKVASVLDPKLGLKDRILEWFISKQLSDYLNVFDDGFEAAWIDKIDRRYSWVKKVLMQFESDYKDTFPLDWGVDERICVEFCTVTKRELTKIMEARAADIDVKLLLFAIQRTTNFEAFLAKRFSYSHLKGGRMDGGSDSHFQGIVSKCFEAHLHIYIGAQDKNLAELIDKFTTDLRTQGVPQLGEDAEGTVLPSAGELFVFYKKCMVQCIQLSTGRALLDLTDTFKKYLVEYANKLLMGNLPKVSTTGGLASLLKDNEVKFTEDEKRMICCILTTAEYCQETTQQLQDKLREKIDDQFVEKIGMNSEQDHFHLVITNSIQLLVQDLENNCEPALTAMMKVHWQSIETVGDQSAYVSAIVGHLHKSIPVIRDNLYSSRKYFTQFCIKFVNSFIPRFINNIYKCKPLPITAAEQLLLDTYSIKEALLKLPALGTSVERQPPSSFTKVVVKGMYKAEMILKVVMSSHNLQTSFVENYIKLLNDGDVSNFQKILDMKGMRRSEQHSMLEIFRTQMVTNPNGAEAVPETAMGTDSSRIKRLEKLIKKQF